MHWAGFQKYVELPNTQYSNKEPSYYVFDIYYQWQEVGVIVKNHPLLYFVGRTFRYMFIGFSTSNVIWPYPISLEWAKIHLRGFLTLINTGGPSFSIGESQFLCNQTSRGPQTNLKTQVCPFWSSRKKTERSICHGLFVVAQQSSRTPFSKYRNWDFNRFLPIFNKFPEFSKNSQGTSLKAMGLKFWILPLYIHI